MMAPYEHANHMDGSFYSTFVSPDRETAMRKMRAMGHDMIQEDHNMPSNLPGHVIRKAYPKTGMMPMPHLNDTITGIDDQMESDARNISRQFATRKI